jgi:hypothetical protein
MFFLKQKLAQQSEVKLQDFEKHGKVFVLEANVVEDWKRNLKVFMNTKRFQVYMSASLCIPLFSTP